MKKVIAKQLLYTRVEEKFSPSKFSGYQVYYSSPDLNHQEIEDIVIRINNFQPNLNNVVRLQCFFINSNNHVVLTRTSIIDSHPEIIDKSKRPGVLIAHCLIFSMEDYKALRCNPFIVFENFQFTTSASELIESYNQGEQKEVPAKFDTVDNVNAITSSKWVEYIIPLVYMASPKFISQNGTLQIYGAQSDINEAVKAIFEFIPLEYRQKLTFDTYAAQEVQSLPNKYWMVGFHERKTGYSITLDASKKIFNTTPESYTDLYSTWLVKVINNEKIAIPQISDAQNLADFIYKKEKIDKKSVGDATLTSFYDANRNYFETELCTILEKSVNKSFARKLGAKPTAFFSEEEIISIVSQDNVSGEQINLIVFKWLSENKNMISTSDFLLFVELLLRNNPSQNLDELSDYIPNLSNKELTNLEKIVPDGNISEQFCAALISHRNKLGAPYNFINSLLGRK